MLTGRVRSVTSWSAVLFWDRYTTSVEDTQASSNQRPGALRFVVAALIVRAGEVLICQRRPDQPMALQWEFPGGKIEPGEGPEQARAPRQHRTGGRHGERRERR